MNESLLPIGRFSQLSELTIRALRLYDELGLLPPERVDEGSGFRYYRTSQLERAELIAKLRRTTMPLPVIGEFLDCPDPERLRLLKSHRESLEDRLAATTQATRLLDQLAGRFESPTAPASVHATPMIGKTLWDQPVLCIRAEWTEEDVQNYGFVHDVADGVAVITPTCDLVADKGYIEEVFAATARQSLATVAPPYFTCSQPGEDGVWRTEVGWPVERPGTADGRVEPATLPGCDIASTIYKGRFEDIAFAYRHLWTQIAAAGHTPIDNPREIYVTPPEFAPMADDYFTEVVWPITRRQ